MHCCRIGNYALNVYDASWALTKHGIAKVNIFTSNFPYQTRFYTSFSIHPAINELRGRFTMVAV